MSDTPEFIVFDTKDRSTVAEGDDLEDLYEQLELQFGSDELDIYDPWGED